MKVHDIFAVINKAFVGFGAWMVFGFVLVVTGGLPFVLLKSPLSWFLWCLAAPILFVLVVGVFGSVVSLVPKAWVDWVMKSTHWVMKSTPIGWWLNWILSGEDAIDRMLRVGASALAFLVIFLVALRLIFGPA